MAGATAREQALNEGVAPLIEPCRVQTDGQAMRGILFRRTF